MADIEQGRQFEPNNANKPQSRNKEVGGNKFRKIATATILASALAQEGCTTLMDISSPSITTCNAHFPLKKLGDGRWAEITNQAEGECHMRSTRFDWDNTPAEELTTASQPPPKPKPEPNIESGYDFLDPKPIPKRESGYELPARPPIKWLSPMDDPETIPTPPIELELELY